MHDPIHGAIAAFFGITTAEFFAAVDHGTVEAREGARRRGWEGAGERARVGGGRCREGGKHEEEDDADMGHGHGAWT